MVEERAGEEPSVGLQQPGRCLCVCVREYASIRNR